MVSGGEVVLEPENDEWGRIDSSTNQSGAVVLHVKGLPTAHKSSSLVEILGGTTTAVKENATILTVKAV